MSTSERAALDRRQFLGGAATVAAMAVTGVAVIHPGEAWGMETKALKPETMRTLIRMARDVYPHDKLADKYYAIAMKGYDEKSASDKAMRDMLEKGVADLDQRAMKAQKKAYAEVGWEADRVAILRGIESSKFFQTIRGNLVTGLYNQKEIWPTFGYEGESASKGGYINRGFNDIAWI